jgi:PAS domain-containing protein
MFDRAVAVKLSESAASRDLEETMALPGMLLGLLENHLQLGLWRLEIPSGILFWSPRAFEIYGQVYGPGPVDPALAIEMLVPQDRKRAADVMVRAIQDKTGFEYTLRIAIGGAIRVIDCIGGVELSDAGAVQAVVDTVRDVTDRAQADDLSTGRGSLLRSLLKNVPAAIAVFDRNMNYLAVSDHWLAGHSHSTAAELIGKNHYVVRPDIAPEHKAEHGRVLAGETIRSPRGYLKDRQGRTISQVCTMAPWLTPGGEVGGMILMLPTVDQSHVFAEPEDNSPMIIDDLPTMGEFMSVLKQIAA